MIRRGLAQGPRFFTILAILWLLILAPAVARADEVILKNGDPVHGKILGMEDERLEIDTDFAGKIKIDWEDIQSLTSDRRLFLIFYSEGEIPEGVGIRDGDQLIVTKLEAGGPIRFSNVKAINARALYYRGNLNVGGNYTSGNTETQALNLSGSYTHRQARHRLQVDGKYNRGSAKGELVAQNAAGSIRYDYYLSRQLYVLGNQLFEYDLFQNLAIRSTTMAGLGYDLFDHKSHLLTFGAGPAVVYQNFTTEPNTLSPSAMWLVRWYRELRGGDLRLFHHHQGFQDFGASRAFRLNADQGIRVKIFGDFSLNLEYDLRFNTEPAPGRKELDQAFIFGVAYEIER